VTKDALWQIYTARNPAFLTDGASFTAAGLRKFFEQTWEAAHAQGVKNGKAIAATDRCDNGLLDIADILQGLTGR
jgi:hypothetical protein